MDIAPPNEDNENNEEQQIVVENPSIDLEVYANQYAGIVRLHRLIYVADVCPVLAVEALKMAITYVQTTYNVNLYQVLHKRLSDLNAGNAPAPPANAGGDQAGAAAPGPLAAAPFRISRHNLWLSLKDRLNPLAKRMPSPTMPLG